MLRLFLVDDHVLLRDGMKHLLEEDGEVTVVAEASTAREAMALLGGLEFDVLLLDLALPGTDGIAVLHELKRRRQRQPVLVLSGRTDPEVVAEALVAGASGFATKQLSGAELHEAIRTVAAGRQYLAPSLCATSIAERIASQKKLIGIGGPLAALSRREREIFRLLVRGFQNYSVAEELCISEKTVETHRQHILRKLDLHSMAELVRFAARHQLLDHQDHRNTVR